MTATKRIMPPVRPKSTVEDVSDASEEVVKGFGEGLPPITHIKPPDMKHMSTKIRWFCGLGYSIKEVSVLLGVRYQQVRNVATQEPKRAAREDVPPYVIELWEVDDDLEAMDKHAIEVEMAAQRTETRKAQRATNKARRELRTAAVAETEEDEVDEITEQE